MADEIHKDVIGNLVQNAEDVARERAHRASVSREGVRTIDTEIQKGRDPIYGTLRAYLLEETRTRLIHDLRGLPPPETKAKSLWETHFPQPLEGASEEAAALLLEEPSLNWGLFMDDPLIENALVEDVVHNFLGDLAESASYVRNAVGDPEYPARRRAFIEEQKQQTGQTPEESLIETNCGKEAPLQKWKRQCPAIYSQAESTVDDWMEQAYSSEHGTHAAQDALGAIKATRMMACCLLHAHLNGNVTFDPSDSRTGDASRVLRVKSPVLDQIRNFGQGGYEQRILHSRLSQVSIGTVASIEFGPSTQESAQLLRQVYDVPENGDPYERLFDLLMDETNPRNSYFRENRLKWTPNHTVDQIAKSLSPILAMDPQKMRQKKMNPSTILGLYSLASELEMLSRHNVFPFLGTDQLPSKMPPNFKLRFDKGTMEERNWTVGDLAKAGINPIVHERFEEVTREVMTLVPEMHAKLMDKGILGFLKRAHTNNVVLEPLKQELLQDELRRGFKYLDKDRYGQVVVAAYKEVDPQKYQNLTERDIRERNPIAHIHDTETRLGILDNVFKEGLKRLSGIPQSVSKLEDYLMSNREVVVHHLAVDSSLRSAFPLQPHPLIPSLDPSRKPAEGKLVEFQREVIPYNDRATIKGLFLSDLHFKSVAQSSDRGVLPDWTIAMQGLYTTFKKADVARAFGHHSPRAMEKLQRVTDQYVDEAREVGIMGFPYFHRAGSAANPEGAEVDFAKESSVKGIPMLRIRNHSKNKDVPKYATPSFKTLRSVNDPSPVREVPVYISPHYVSKDAADVLKTLLSEEVLNQLGEDAKTPENKVLVEKALMKSGFENYYKAPLDNTRIPLFCIEGEKKSQAVECLQQMQMIEKAKEVLGSMDPEKSLSELKPVDFRATVGMVGVWITMRKPGSRDHVLRPEFEETVNLKDRKVVLMYDGDGLEKGSETNNHQVMGASVTSAHVLKRDFNVTPYHWRPPEGPGKGADDWIEEHAKRQDSGTWKEKVYTSYLDMEKVFTQQIRPLRTDLNFKDILAAQKKKLPLDTFVSVSEPAVSR